MLDCVAPFEVTASVRGCVQLIPCVKTGFHRIFLCEILRTKLLSFHRNLSQTRFAEQPHFSYNWKLSFVGKCCDFESLRWWISAIKTKPFFTEWMVTAFFSKPAIRRSAFCDCLSSTETQAKTNVFFHRKQTFCDPSQPITMFFCE